MLHFLNKNFRLAHSVWVFLLLASASHADIIHLKSKTLTVDVDSGFPRIIRYRHAHGGAFDGQQQKVSTILLNGTPSRFKVSFERTDQSTALYRLDFPEKQITVSMTIKVEQDVVTIALTRVVERGEAKLMFLSFPGNALLTLDSSLPGAEVAAVAASYTDERRANKTAGTVHKRVFREVISPISQAPTGQHTANYFFAAAGKLAAGIASNHYVDYKRIEYTITQTPSGKTCKAWCPVWAYREIKQETVDLPYAKVFITPDRNNDGKVTWQDAAIAYRKNMPMPLGHEYVKSTVGSNIAMNFASGAQQPFLRILDNIKRIHRATDGLANQVIIKGFSAEGHDSANTDYSGHTNKRAGGLEDFNTLLNNAHMYNTRIGIHINVTEIYPESIRYDDKILFHDKDGKLRKRWIWLDQSYEIDKRKDILSGSMFSSLDKMKQELPQLDFVYIDKNHAAYWESMKIAQKITSLGLPLYVEGNFSFDPYTTWAHHRGNMGKIIQFLWYSDRDIFPNNAILRGGRNDNDGFMDWQRHHSFTSSIHGTFSRNLPAKYLKNFELLRWEPGKLAEFSGGVRVVMDRDIVKVTRNGHLLMTWTKDLKQSRLFVPWKPESQEKIYLWDEVGTKITWSLPESWSKLQSVYLYKLSDKGRCEEKKLPVNHGTITLTPEKNTPYVLYPKKAPEQMTYVWGEGSAVKDPDFNSLSFKNWKRESSSNKVDHIQIRNDSNRNPRLVISGDQGNDATVSQIMTGLKPEQTYAAEVWVLVKGKRHVEFEIQAIKPGTSPVSTYLDQTTVKHCMACDPRNHTNYQRLTLRFTTPKGCTSAKISLKVAQGDPHTSVEFDGVRVAKDQAPSPESKKHWFYEDFESTALGGFGAFTCNFGERTHLSETNKPYTKDTIHGRYSLKTRDQGRVVRTVPGTLRFKPRTRYRFVCETLTSEGAKGRITVNSGGKVIADHPIPTGRGKVSFEFTTSDDTESFLSLFKDQGDYIVIDDVAIDELGSAQDL